MRLLCDAVAIIEAFKNKIWEHLISHHEIYTGSIVAKTEAIYYEDEFEKHYIDLTPYMKENKIQIISASSRELEVILHKVYEYRLDIDAGETECLALMQKREYSGLYFCTGDAAAVKSAYVLGVSDRLVSLEKCIKKKVKLPYKCTRRWLEKVMVDAIQQFGTGKKK